MCLRCTRPGYGEAVAIMGTALTQEQLAELAKVGDSNRRGMVFLALDADRAGREAMLRAARLAEDRGVDLPRDRHAGGHRSGRSREPRTAPLRSRSAWIVPLP